MKASEAAAFDATLLKVIGSYRVLYIGLQSGTNSFSQDPIECFLDINRVKYLPTNLPTVPTNLPTKCNRFSLGAASCST